MSAPSTCSRCGAPVTPGAHFCTRCGADISGEQGAVATVKMSLVDTGADPQADLLVKLRQATIGEFEVLGELGRGGMATVYLAHEIALGRKVAIKVMNPALVGTGAQMVERFKREARTAAALSHPHIIPIYAVRETPFIFFVMKFVKGRSLDSIIKTTGQLPIPMIQAILHQSGGAIDYAHRQGIIHRDIKPANIMLDEDGWAVVTDFGIAKVADSQHLTMTGVTVGTPTYMSPEQCAAKDVTAASDQYSLGIVAYEMVTGQVPFSADTVMGVMWQHFNDPPRPIHDLRPDCPPDIEQAILRMLAKKPDERFPSVEDAIDAIGTPVLRRDDPTRQQMKALAKQGAGAEVLSRVHTPTSPIPKTGAPPAATPSRPITAAPTTPAPAPTTPAPPSREIAEQPTVVAGGSIADAPTTLTPATPPSGPPPIPEAPTVYAAAPPPPPPATIAERAPPPPIAPPIAPPAPRPTPVPAAPPRRRALPLALGAAAVVVLAAAGWFVFGPKGGPTTPSGTPAAPAPAAPAPVAAIQVTPSPASIAVGGTVQLAAALVDAQGKLLGGRSVTWTVADTTVARVAAGGLVTARAPGSTSVTAASEGKTATATVIVTATVTPVASVAVAPNPATVVLGDSLALAAAPRDARGNTLGGRAVEWTSNAPAVASVSPEGTVVALREGDATITAAVEGRRATVRVTVTPPAVAAVEVTPAQVSLTEGGRQQLSVVARDRRGTVLTGRAATWTSSDEEIVLVTSTGGVRAMGTGRATITARVDDITGTAVVTVGAVPVASVALAQPPALPVGGTTMLQAALRDPQGRPLERPVTWSSSDPRVAAVAPNGQLTAVAAGTATITATSEGQTTRVTVTVTAPAVVAGGEGAQPAGGPPAAGQPAGGQPAAGQPAGGPPAGGGAPSEAAAAILPRRAIAAGGQHSCGITSTGRVSCWGANASFQLADAAPGVPQSEHAAMLSSLKGVSAVTAGGAHTCALLGDGSAVCWGLNRNGQLGATGAGPVTVGGTRTFTALSAGARHTCALASDGTAWCWGDNNLGQLGDGSTRGGAQPRAVRGGLKFRAIAAGGDHTCAVAQDGRAYCWGDGFSGQLGRGIRESQLEPVPVSGAVRFTAIVSGAKHSCALAQNGTAHCWGENRNGEIGDGSKAERGTPTAVGRLAFTALTAGTGHTCGLTEAGDASCWGDNREGQLGDGSKVGRPAPVRVGAGPFRALSAGGTHTCGITRGDAALCWGGNARGQVGDGTTAQRSSPVAVTAGP